MAKKSTKELEFLDTFDSKEELYFSWYLEELKADGFIYEYKHEPNSFLLSEKVEYEWEKVTELKTKTKQELKTTTLLREHSYTPDFFIKWTDKGENVLHGLDPKKGYFISDSKLESWVDVKGSWDMQNMTRLFTINQKWMYDKYGIYVNKIIPDDLFAKTFTPKRFTFTDKSVTRLRAIKFNVKLLNEYKIRENIK